MVEEDNCVFFLPHRPRGKICEPPMFLFMKGTGSVKTLQPYQLSLHLCSIVFFFVKFIFIHVADSSCLTKSWINTGWCGAGADHYEPLIAHPSLFASQEKVAVVL